MDNEESFSYSPEAVPPVPSPPIEKNTTLPTSRTIQYHHNLQVIADEEPDMTPRRRKQMARAYARANVPLSKLEQTVLNQNPDLQVTNDTYVVEEIYDYRVINNNPMVRLKWADSLQHLGFVRFNPTKTEEDFTRRRNGKKFAQLMRFIKENPTYESVIIPDEEFNKPEDDNEEEPEAARKNTGGKRLPQKQLPKKKILVGPPNPPKSK